MPRFRLALPAIAVAAVLSTTATAELSSQAQRAPARNVPRNSAISGAVSDGASGQPLSTVIVSLTACGTSLNSVTDSKGRFVFRNLPACDTCRLNAEKPGYVAAGLTRRGRVFDTTPIGLAENEWIADANIVMLRPGGISGTVVDEKGEPLVGVPVRALMTVPIAGNPYWGSASATRTDDRGYYRLPGLLGGRYIVQLPSVQSVVPPDTPQATIQGVRVNNIVPQALTPVPGIDFGQSWLVLGQYPTPPPGGREGYPALYFPGVRTLREATAVELGQSEERKNIDFVVRPTPVARVSGRVVGPPEAIGGLVIRLFNEDTDVLSAGYEQATALVASDGTFMMVNVPVGNYVLDARRVSAEVGTAPAMQRPVTPGFVWDTATVSSMSWVPGTEFAGGIRAIRDAASARYSGRVTVSVGPGGATDVVLPLQRGASISGRVISEDGSEFPVRSVTADPASGNPALYASSIRDLRSEPTSTFVISGLEPGEYFLRALMPKSIVVGGIDYTNRSLTVLPGVDIADVVITRAAQPASLDGSVRNRDGAPLREAAVIVFPVDRAQWANFGIEPPGIKSVTFFGNPKYEFPRMPAGEYYVVALTPSMRDAWQDPRFYPAAAAVATRVTLDWGKSTTQDLILRQVTLR